MSLACRPVSPPPLNNKKALLCVSLRVALLSTLAVLPAAFGQLLGTSAACPDQAGVVSTMS